MSVSETLEMRLGYARRELEERLRRHQLWKRDLIEIVTLVLIVSFFLDISASAAFALVTGSVVALLSV